MQAQAETAATAAEKQSQGLLALLRKFEVEAGENKASIRQLKQQLQECQTQTGQRRDTVQRLRRQLEKFKGLKRKKIELARRLAKVDKLSFQLQRQAQVVRVEAESDLYITWPA